jgi:hypothetical protein
LVNLLHRSLSSNNNVLNTKHFVLLAGDPHFWDQEIKDRIAKNENLTDIQVEQHRHGRRSATIAKGIKGWYVRAANNLMIPIIIYPTTETFGQKQTAIAYGKNWAERDPQN